MTINMERWRTWAEIIGILAVVASLIFVGIETRNSTKQAELTAQALEIASYQELISSIIELNHATLENPDVAALMYKAWRTDDELTDMENFRLSRAMFARLRHGDMAFFQYQRGAISEERLRSVLMPLSLNHPRVIEFWNRSKGNFVQAYQDYIDAEIASTK